MYILYIHIKVKFIFYKINYILQWFIIQLVYIKIIIGNIKLKELLNKFTSLYRLIG